ncbi:hypothetical protein DPMN_080957 [Dreissena polymorpha]|uniref:MAM domain-containing protein n=1 Tax=Dreissena polymorpha TaxID=45954 RepID=A0A9D3Y7R9_DREPO|nr:hypothetical protein DPMN_080957 [Dreissena polymorpha]
MVISWGRSTKAPKLSVLLLTALRFLVSRSTECARDQYAFKQTINVGQLFYCDRFGNYKPIGCRGAMCYFLVNNVVAPISLTLCKNYTVEVQEWFCDFEKDSCEWRQEIGSQFDWIRRNGIADSSRETGPLFEFTAEIGLSYLSDIALDDIRIKQGKC